MKFYFATVLANLVGAIPYPYMRLKDDLEEANDLGFCIDLRGFGPILKGRVRFKDVQLHSCKTTKIHYDQQFHLDNETSQIKALGSADGRCL